MLLAISIGALVLIFCALYVMAYREDERRHKEHREAMNTVWLRPYTKTDDAYNGWLSEQQVKELTYLGSLETGRAYPGLTIEIPEIVLDSQTWPHEGQPGYDVLREEDKSA